MERWVGNFQKIENKTQYYKALKENNEEVKG